MVEFLTRAQAKAFRDNQPTTASVIVEKAEKRAPASSTFLSHSTKDMELVPKAVQVLEKHGAAVYLDKKDPSLPPYTSRRTAEILRDRIAKSKKLVVLATKNSKDSRWVPWELGQGDGRKGLRNVAVFPAVENQSDTAWTATEYIGIYDQIVFGKHKDFSEKIWMVWNRDKNTATELSQWLKR